MVADVEGGVEYQALKARALAVLLAGASDQERSDIQEFLKKLEQKAIDAAEAQKVLDAFVLRARELEPNRAGFLSAALEVLQSPPFYFFFGCALLALAFLTSQLGLNTSLTFLVAMLGVAILLYGTGSQAVGTFGANPQLAAQLLTERERGRMLKAAPTANGQAPAESTVETMTLAPAQPFSPALTNLVIAGGAAMLTAFFGWGVIKYQRDIRLVFRDHDTYTRVEIDFCDAATTGCTDAKISDNVALERSGLRDETLQQVVQKAYLETALGARAFGKASDKGVEFIVFERDMGESKKMRLLGASAKQETAVYSANDTFFSVVDSAKTTPAGGVSAAPDAAGEHPGSDNSCLVRFSETSCALIVTARDSIDIDRVPRIVIRAALRLQSLAPPLPPATDDGVIPDIVDSEDPVVPR